MDLPDPAIEPVSAASPELASRFFSTAPLGKPPQVYRKHLFGARVCGVCAGDKQDKEGLFPHGFYHLREEADR